MREAVLVLMLMVCWKMRVVWVEKEEEAEGERWMEARIGARGIVTCR